MTWGDALQAINYIDVVVAVVLSGLIGFIWYGPRGFEKTWMKLVGLKKRDLQKREGMGVLFGIMYGVFFVAGVLIASLLELAGMSGGGDGALMGGLVGLAAFFGPLLSTYGFARRTFQLALIDGGYVLVTFIVMGTVIGAGVF